MIVEYLPERLLQGLYPSSNCICCRDPIIASHKQGLMLRTPLSGPLGDPWTAQLGQALAASAAPLVLWSAQ